MPNAGLTQYDYSLLAMYAYRDDPSQGLASGVLFEGNSANYGVPATEGFSADVYKIGSQVVISFEGTNDFQDILTGWPIESGVVTSQVKAAATLYLAVRNMYGADNVSVTGHSLGGALAGIIGTLYGATAVLFDNEPFGVTAADILQLAQQGDQSTLSTFFPNEMTVPAVLNYNVVSGAYVQGEPLQAYRSGDQEPFQPSMLATGSSTFDPVDWHQPQFLGIYEYGDSVYSGGSWLQDGNALFNSLTDNALASPFQGLTSASDMRDALANSALDPSDAMTSGSTGPDGDVGLMALFSGTNILGQVVQSSSVSAGFKSNYLQAFTDLAVQYATDLAVNASSDLTKASGIITISDDTAIVDVDIGSIDWDLGSNPPMSQPGISTLLTPELQLIEQANTESLNAFEWLYGSEDPDIGEFEVADTDGAFSDGIPGGPVGADTTTSLFVGGQGNEDITTSSSNTIVEDGDGNDVVIGGAGADLFISGGGDDTFFGGGGNNVVLGNGTNTTVDYRYAEAGITVDLADTNSSFDNPVIGVRDNGSGGADTLLGVTALIGSNYNDTFDLY